VDRDDNVIVTVDGEEYTLADDATMSIDDNDTVVAATEDGMEDFVGNEATLYLNRDGDARHIVGDFTVEETAFAGVINGEAIGFLSDFLGIGMYVEFTLTEDGLLETLEEVDLGDDNVHLDLYEDDIDADHNLVLGWRAASGIVIVDTGEWELVPWSSFEEMSIEGEPIDNVNVESGGDATAETVIFDNTEHGVDYDIAAEDVGIVLARKVTADGIAVKVLVEDETATYQVADAEYGALDLSNDGFESDSLSDIDVGDLVYFEHEGDEFNRAVVAAFDARLGTTVHHRRLKRNVSYRTLSSAWNASSSCATCSATRRTSHCGPGGRSMHAIIIYDVDQRRVQRVCKFLRQHLTWVQNSAFEGELSESRRAPL